MEFGLRDRGVEPLAGMPRDTVAPPPPGLPPPCDCLATTRMPPLADQCQASQCLASER